MSQPTCGQYMISFCEYDTPKMMTIRSFTIGIVNKLIQVLIICYVVGYVIIYNKGYQEFSLLQSAVTSKVKGVVHTQQLGHVWDVADYVVPPQENGAFFVMTNAIITPNQTQSTCPEVPLPHAICDPKEPHLVCEAGKPVRIGHGVMTGKCVAFNDKFFTCEIRAWCPIEMKKLSGDKPLLSGTEEFTVLIKNSIQFSRWPNIKTRNIMGTWDPDYLKHCRYDLKDNILCPIFRFGTIVHLAKENYTELALKGGVMGIFIHWDCDLDYDIKECTPTYNFHRLDSANGHVAPGWNFRFAQRYTENLRTLYKAYGILFVVMVEGRGRKFNVIPLLLNVGSGLALLSIAKIVSDFFVLHILKKRHFYRKKKFINVNDEEEDSPKRIPIIYHKPPSNGNYINQQRHRPYMNDASYV